MSVATCETVALDLPHQSPTTKDRQRRLVRHTMGLGLELLCGVEDRLSDTSHILPATEDFLFLPTVQDGSYDWIHVGSVLLNVACPQAALLSWFRCLKPFGKLIISVLHHESSMIAVPSCRTHWDINKTEPPKVGLIEIMNEHVFPVFKFDVLSACIVDDTDPTTPNNVVRFHLHRSPPPSKFVELVARKRH